MTDMRKVWPKKALSAERQRDEAVADRDRWKAAASRLAAAALTLLEVEAAYDRNFPHEHPLEVARREMLAALAALTAETEEK